MFLGGNAAAILRGSPVGRFQVTARNPYVRESHPLQLADAGQAAIRRVRDLAADPAVPEGFTTTTEAARTLQNLAATDPSAAASFQLVGIGTAP
jgi:hypothetical protein